MTQVLRWADAYHARAGKWPSVNSGPIRESPDDTWRKIGRALEDGLRGLLGGSSLPLLLEEHRGVRHPGHLPPLSTEQILDWADAHRKQTGEWPKARSGRVTEAPEETWGAINLSLTQGRRGLPRGSSLAKLLARYRRHPNPQCLPPLTYKQILVWADAHHARAGNWPTVKSGPVKEDSENTWRKIHTALSAGVRGLPGGSSLPRFLEEYRGVRNRDHLPPLSINQILEWSDAHRKRTGRWPTDHSGPVAEAPEETWGSISQSLKAGRGGLPGGSTLVQLLARRRGKRNHLALPRLTSRQIRASADVRPAAKRRSHLRKLTIRQILTWADNHREHTGRWPNQNSGVVQDGSPENWRLIDHALRVGFRGLSGGSSLIRLLADKRGARNLKDLPRLTVRRILTWADQHHRLRKQWPRLDSGSVSGVHGETWATIDSALRKASRGLARGGSLARLLTKYRGTRNDKALPRLTTRRILAWADEHKRRTGRWPLYRDGPVTDAPGESWNAINIALDQGLRGLAGGSSLIRLLAEHRGARNRRDLPRLTIPQILAWADKHRRLHKEWPQYLSGPVQGVPGETWSSVNTALQAGSRGLPGGETLAQLLATHRHVKRGRILAVGRKRGQ